MMQPHRFISHYLAPNPSAEKLSAFLDENSLQYAKAQILCLVVSGMLCVALSINLFEQNSQGLSWPLFAMCLLMIPNFFLLVITKSGFFPLLNTSLLLMGLGLYLILVRSMPDGSSLLWFLLLPPMFMFCVGLRLGSILFVCFLFLLGLFFCTPLDRYLVHDFPISLRLRCLASMAGSYIFALLAELMRYNTYKALRQAASLLEHHALTDPLTGLGNRRDFQNYFQANQAQAARLNREFSVALVDIDFFKTVNDNHGHEVGDHVLCHLTAVLSKHLRGGDRLFRWGGEEFVILMPETPLWEARKIAERLREAMEHAAYVMEDKTSINLTISIGLCSGSPFDNIETYLRGADENLYKAKNSGRNQVQG